MQYTVFFFILFFFSFVKNDNFSDRVLIFSHFVFKTLIVGHVSGGGSNEYPQSMF